MGCIQAVRKPKNRRIPAYLPRLAYYVEYAQCKHLLKCDLLVAVLRHRIDRVTHLTKLFESLKTGKFQSTLQDVLATLNIHNVSAF